MDRTVPARSGPDARAHTVAEPANPAGPDYEMLIHDHKLVVAELERRAAQQAAVARLGEHALEGTATDQLIQEAVDAAAQLLDVEIAGVVQLTGDRRSFVFRGNCGLPESTGTDVLLPAGAASQAGYAIVSGRPVIVADWETERRFARAPILAARGVCSGITVVIQGRRAPFGVLGLHTLALREFSAGDVDFAQAIANVLGDAFERQLTEDEIRHRALHDLLTGLPNRVLFVDRLQQALERLRRRRSMTAILVLDFDHFKLVNDSLGHHAGDELITAAAPRLRQALRSSDTVARFSGDVFGVLLEEISGEHDAIEMAERIAAVFARPFVLNGNEHFVTTSIGISVAQGAELAEELIVNADAAMHRAKERGGARYELFDQRIRARSISRLRVENDLRRALDRDELFLHYQPLISLRDPRIVGVEALLRWQHPDRGLVAPGAFIPVAEANGLIEPIGRWVLERACRQAAHWHRARPDAAPIRVGVNLSAVQIANRGLAGIVSTVLRATELDPNCLTLEVTESVLLADGDGVTRALQALKATGVSLVLDDFGTGYSSLAYLTRLPLDALKIDRSFIVGLGVNQRDTAITEAIVAMSHALSLKVVAEGVETPEQLEELSRIGCDFVQGFHYSRPVPAAEITAMLQHAPAWSHRSAQG